MFVEYALRRSASDHLVRRRDERVPDHLERDGIDRYGSIRSPPAPPRA